LVQNEGMTKWLVLNNGQLEFTFCLCFKWLVLNDGQLECTFIMFQVVSPGQWTAWVYLMSLFQVVSPTMDNLSLPFFLFQVVSLKQRTTCVNQSFSQVSSLVCLVKRCLHKLSFQTNTIIHHHFPQWNYIIP